MGKEEVREYLLHLKEQRKLGASHLNVTVCALKFLYRVTLERPEVMASFTGPKPAPKLPTILSGTEIEALFAGMEAIKYRAVLMTAYGAGLRISETCALEVQDIDSRRMGIHVRNGKGGRQRYVMLSERLLLVLREYWKHTRPARPYLFPGDRPNRHVSADSVRTVLRKVAQKLGFEKRVTPHTMRHSFATHLLEAGEDIRVIQVLLGHRSIRSTLLYTQVTPGHITRTKSPLDLLGTKKGAAFG
jgi:site-specific recombinase XerD